MQDEVGIAVVGASGRMGRMLVQAVGQTPGARLSGATERPGHPWIGRDVGEALGGPALGVLVEDDPLEVFARSQAVLDFTAPEATVLHADLAAQARLTHVVGTTGLERPQLERLAAAARHAVIVRAGNMSVGVNLLTVMARRVAAVLGPEYDIEIVEMHHRAKVDAPSGTALCGIGFASLRGGDVIGEHAVIFAGDGERLTLGHVATDRMLFARGALRAALWGQGQPPGQYDMTDVLGLREEGEELPDR